MSLRAIIALLWFTAVYSKKPRLFIGGVFPMSAKQGGWAGGQACLPAFKMAVKQINNDATLLKDYDLELMSDDSECEPGKGVKIMYDLLYQKNDKILLMLTGCSLVTTVIAEASPIWNLLVMSYGGSSPALSDRERFPSLFRTHPSATFHNPTRVLLFQKYEWKVISILSSVEEVFLSTAEDLENLCRKSGIETSRQTIGDPSDAVKNLERQGARIIVGLFYEKEARKVLCQAFKNELYGKRYVWFFIGWYGDKWYSKVVKDEHLQCTPQEMYQAALYHFTTEAVMTDRGNKKGISGMTGNEFEEKLKRKLADLGVEDAGGLPEATLAFDAAWAIAMALDCADNKLTIQGQKLTEFHYKDDHIYRQIYACMNRTSFAGVSGKVEFANGDRVAVSMIEQLQGDENETGKYEMIGFHDVHRDSENTNMLNWNKVKFHVRQHAGYKVPVDHSKLVPEPQVISKALFYSFCAGMIMILLIVVACAIFSWYYRVRKNIQQSHIFSNCVVLVGIVVCILAAFLMGLDDRLVRVENFPKLCQSRLWILNYGFVVAYGAMFGKVWHSYKLNSKQLRDRPIVTRRLFVPMAIVASVDFIVLLFWAGFDPLRLHTEKMEKKDLDRAHDEYGDVELVPQLQHCWSDHLFIWIGILFAVKGIWLIMGLKLSYDIRNVKIRYLNDTRYVCMAIYNVVVLSFITGPVSLIILSQSNASFAFIAATILLCCLVTLGLIFVPKVVYVATVSGAIEAKAAQDRQVTADEEHRYHQIVQENEDIKRQIAEREAKIRELRRRLDEHLANNPDLRHRASTVTGGERKPGGRRESRLPNIDSILSPAGRDPLIGNAIPVNVQINESNGGAYSTFIENELLVDGDDVEIAVDTPQFELESSVAKFGLQNSVVGQANPNRDGAMSGQWGVDFENDIEPSEQDVLL